MATTLRWFASALVLGLAPACFNPEGKDGEPGSSGSESGGDADPGVTVDEPTTGTDGPTTGGVTTGSTGEAASTDEIDGCADGRLGGDETDLDCGGACPPCDDGQICVDGEDCESQTCVREVCVRDSSCTVSSDCSAAQCHASECEAGMCVSSPSSGGACDDGLVCTTDEACVAGACTASSPKPIALVDLEVDPSLGLRFTGAMPAQQAGLGVGPAGDFNGDGIDDLLVVTRGDMTVPPGVHVLFGGPGLANTTLAGVASGQGGFLIEADIGDPTVNATAIGDHDGDGRDDVLIGASVNATKGGRGGVYVIRGRKGEGSLKLNAEIDGDLYLGGPPALATQFGASVAGLGDIDGDGFSDFAVGAPFHRVGDAEVGAVFVVLGTQVLLPGMVQEYVDGGNGYRIDGPAGGAEFGHSVAGIGDFDQDFRPDLAIGQPSRSSHRGRVYVLYSSVLPSSFQVVDPLLPTLGVTISGDALLPMSRLGAALAGAGDFNFDNASDLLIGGSPSLGRALVVFGASDETVIDASEVVSGGHGVEFVGFGLTEGFGVAVAGGGDINGDSRHDVVIGAPYQGGVGRVFVGFGRESPATVSGLELASGEGGFAIDGEGANTEAGLAVAVVPSVNGDELMDVMIGAPHVSVAGGHEGRAYVVHGGPCERR